MTLGHAIRKTQLLENSVVKPDRTFPLLIALYCLKLAHILHDAAAQRRCKCLTGSKDMPLTMNVAFVIEVILVLNSLI
jgi:hypothetical protein